MDRDSCLQRAEEALSSDRILNKGDGYDVDVLPAILNFLIRVFQGARRVLRLP